MALKWVEGFESYSSLINFIQFRYATFNGGTSSFVPGRAIGNALSFSGTSLVTPNLGNQNEYITGFAFNNVSLGTSNVNMTVFQVLDAVTPQITVTFNPSTNVFSVWRGPQTSLLGTGTFVTTPGAWYYVELRVVVDPAVGVATLKVNTIVDVNFSGNTQVSANPFANTFSWSGPAAATITGAYLLDDIYINDATGVMNNTFLGDMKVEGVNVIDKGNYTQWGVNLAGTPNFQAVQVLNDGLYVSSNTVGQKDAYECSGLNFITSNIAGVSAVYWSRNTDSTQHAIQSLVRVSVTDYLGSPITIMDTAFKAYAQIWETNPATLAPWLPAAVSGGTGTEWGMLLNS